MALWNGMVDELVPDRRHPVALCLGGMDPSAGAGLLRDVTTLGSQGILSMAVPLAETLQNGLGCYSIVTPAISPLLALDALRPHLVEAWGVKIGMSALDDPEFATVCDLIREMSPSVRIWDPILAPSLGVSLHSGSRLRRMAQSLLSGGGWVVSPNLPEARLLAGLDATSPSDVDPLRLAAPLLDLGAQAVWLKGGHSSGASVEDFWVTEGGATSLGACSRLPGERRGTGCTLASAWLGHRLLGKGDVPAAVAAIEWLRRHWDEAFSPGGIGRPCFVPRQS